MKLTGLREIYKQMKKLDLESIKFEFTYAKVGFDVIFFIDDSPFILMFGIKKVNQYFEIKVKEGFEIVPFIEDKDVFKTLIKLFEFSGDGDKTFKMKHFFESFNMNIPSYITISSKTLPTDIAKYDNDVEEADRIYFWGWINHGLNKKLNSDYKGSVKQPNLMKTKKYLGKKAFMRCTKYNISSRWTDDKKKEDLKKLEELDDLRI